MHTVPVIDVKAGQVVRAVAGRREEYRPLCSKLCDSSELGTVVEALLILHPFDTFYLADIDRIMGWGDNRAAIAALCKQHPQSEFWLDAGFARPADLNWLADHHNITPVLGSESMGDLDEYEALLKATGRNCILSLDYQRGRFRGPVELGRRRDLWPERMLIMELDRVGTGSGPHIDRLAEHAAERRHYQVYAAGGVRGIDDLRRLEEAHVDGALIATALHDGTLNHQALAHFERRPSA